MTDPGPATADGEAPAWSRDPEVLERVFLEAVGQGDARGVEAALRLMTVVDPRRAQRLYDDLKFGLRFVDVLDSLLAGTQETR